jgi:hypothetical protein
VTNTEGTWDATPAVYGGVAFSDPPGNGFRVARVSIGSFGGVTLIRNIQRWDLAYADAKAKIDELMGP